MVHGRVTRSIALQDSTGMLHGGCFLRDTGSAGASPSVVCAVAAPASQKGHQDDVYSYSWSLAAARYGMVAPAGSKIAATDLLTGEALGVFDPKNVTIAGTLAAFDAKIIKLEVTGNGASPHA